MRFLYCFVFYALIGYSAYGVELSQPAHDPSFIDYKKGKIKADTLLARSDKGVGRDLVFGEFDRIGVQVVREIKIVPGLFTLTLPGNKDLESDQQKLVNLLTVKAALIKSDLFKYVELDYASALNVKVKDSAFVDGTLWGLENLGLQNGTKGADIDIRQAWDVTAGSPETVVAVLDSGVRLTHNDLIDQLWTNEDEIPNNALDDDSDGYIDNYKGIDFFNVDGNPEDPVGHGTHVAGTIVAAANNDSPHVGVAFNAKIMACKVGNMFISDSAVAAAVQFCVDHKVKIVNGSYGGSEPSSAMYDVYKAGGENDMIFIFGAGNWGTDNEMVGFYPSDYDLECIISVAATDNRDQLADFSNYGITSVDLAAPGVDIYSCGSQNDQSYEMGSGTSMATPHVSGVVALMRSIRPDWKVLNVREKLLASVDQLDSLNGKVVTGGRVNAAKAVQNMGVFGVPDGVMQVSVTPPSGSLLMAGDNISIKVEVIDGEKVENAIVTTLSADGNTAFFSNDGEYPDDIDGDNIYTTYFKVPEKQGKLRMTLFVSCEGKQDAIRVIEYNIADIPENDSFDLAKKIKEDSSIIEAFNTFATVERNEPRHSGLAMHHGSLWWKWTASQSGSVFIDTAGSDIDANIAIYRGNDIGELILVKRNQSHDVENRDKGVYFNALSGKTYKFCVSSATESDLGYIRLRVAPDGKPDINPPFISGIMPFNGFITDTNKFEISGLAADPAPNASGVKEVLARVNDSLFFRVVGTEKWFTNLSLEEGENSIELFAIDYSDNISETIKLQYDYFPPDLSNDHFVNALSINRDVVLVKRGQSSIQLTQGVGNINDVVIKRDGIKLRGDQFQIDPDDSGRIRLNQSVRYDSHFEVFNPYWTTPTISTLNATKEFGEPDHANNEGGGSVWYQFTAPYDGVLEIDILESGFDTLLAVYSGSKISDLKLISSNDDAFDEDELEFDPGISRLSQGLRGGMSVYIAIDGYGDDRGNIAIRSLFRKSPVYSLQISMNGEGEIVSPYQPFRDGGVKYSLHQKDELLTVEVAPLEGGQFFGWTGDVNFSEQKFDLVISDDYIVQANFVDDRDIQGFEQFNSSDIRWSLSTGKPWFLDGENSHRGNYSLRSGKIGDLERTTISFKGVFLPGLLSFALKTSTEEDWDRLNFYIDNELVDSWSGVVDWKVVEFPISGGVHNLTWEYKKDFANGSNLDAVWLDDINLPLSISASLKVVEIDGQLSLLIKGEPLHYYNVFKSGDLKSWVKLKSIKLDLDGVGDMPIHGSSHYQFFKVESR
jgi:subtilisin family serine protease